MSVLVGLGVVAIALVVLVLELVRRRRLKERFASIWIVLSVFVALGALFPGVVRDVADFLGFEVAANLVLVAGMIALTLIAIQLSVEVGRLRDHVDRLASRLAVLYAERPEPTDPQGPELG